ncbi:superfamily II DNA/RNA helicase [Streptacidiphilus sp. MAP12-20]|uniref:DEAD/DEAH box helicase n=1 Tax=Streptacidiphilus sp. MAP12-20 TaxID=3156299 RepID=UPI003516C4C2
MTLPVAMSGHDVIGQAKTGTGKTLGFGLPIIDTVRVAADVDAGRITAAELPTAPQALVVVPTRELCTQVTNDLLVAGKVRNVRILSIYGGRGYETQIEALERGVDVIVGTPGRLLDLARQRKLNLSEVRVLVLDEADEMLDLGFLPDVEKIIDMLPAQRQTMLFSATMPGAVISLARRYMNRPTHIRATAPDDEGATVRSVSQHIYRAHSLDKVEMVSRILQAEGRNLAMIFCRTKRTTADVSEQLTKRGFAAGAVHGDLGQGAREQALRAFRNGKVDVLVCTDVAARGIDVEGVTHVINYQCPEDEKTYLHRIGRTGRAGASGTAVTLVDWDDIPRWGLINKALDLKLSEPEETYSSSPHLYEQLHIPAGTKGVLPRGERTRAGLDAEVIEDLGEPGGGRRKPARDADHERPAGRRDRDRPRRGGRGGSDAQEQMPATERSERAERGTDSAVSGTGSDAPKRRRRRTRNGSDGPVEAVQALAPSVAVTAEADASGTDSAPEQAPAEPRRRRSRGSKPAQVAETATEAVTAAPAEVAAPVATEEVVTEAAPTRRRSRAAAKPAESETAVEAVETAETTEPVVETARAPRRRARVAQAEPVAADAPVTAPAESAESAESADEAPAPRKRTRAAKATAEVAPVEAVVEAPVAEETPAPRRRTRGAKATQEVMAEAVPEAAAPVETVQDEAPAAPRRRTRAAKATAEAPVSAPAPVEADVTEATPAPRKRTRATKATAEVAPVEATTVAATTADTAAEAPTPRKRTRATKATAEAVTAEAQATVEAAPEQAPAEPRRGRTRAAKALAEPVDEARSVVAAAEPTAVAPRKRRRATSGVTDPAAKVVSQSAEAPVEAAPAPADTTAVPAPRKRRRATSAVTDATAKAKTAPVAEKAEKDVPAQRAEATSTDADADAERPKRKRRSVRLAEAAAAAAAAESGRA